MKACIYAALFLFVMRDCYALDNLAPLVEKASQDSLVQLASRWYSEGEYTRAIALKDPADSLSPSPRLHYYRGMSCAALNRYPDALDCLQSAIRGDSANINYRFQYAKILIQSGHTAKAAAELSACIAMDSSYLPASFQLGILYNLQKTDPKKEFEIFSFLIRRNPDDFVSLFYAGDALRKLDRADSGIVLIERSLAVNPRYYPSLMACARYQAANEQYASACERYQQALELRPHDKDLLLEIGECSRKSGALKEAVAYFKRAIAIDSTIAVVHAQMGYAYFTMGRFDSSIQAYKTAIDLDNDNVHYYQNLIQAYKQTDSVNAAIAAYRKVIEVLHPENIAYAYGNLANYFYSKNRTDSAVVLYRYSISQAFNGLAAFYNGKKMMREALGIYRRVLEYDPTNIDMLIKIATLSEELHDPKTALESLEKWMRLTEKNPSVFPARQFIKEKIDSLRKGG